MGRWGCGAVPVVLVGLLAAAAQEYDGGGPDFPGDAELTLMHCLSDERCARRLTETVSSDGGNSSNVTIVGRTFDLPINPLYVEFKEPNSSLNLGTAADQAGKITIVSYADLRGLVVGAEPTGGPKYGSMTVPVVLKVAFLAFVNGLVMPPPARRANVSYQVIWADTCKEHEQIQGLQFRCNVPYALRLMQPLMYGRHEDVAPAYSYIPAARAVLGGNKWTPNVAMDAGAQGLPNIGYWSGDRGLSEKLVYPSFVRANPTDKGTFDAMIAVIQHLNFTTIDALVCDVATNRDPASYFNDLVSSAGISMASFFLPPASYTAWPAGTPQDMSVTNKETSLDKKRRWDAAIDGMKAFNAHIHTNLLYRECAAFDVFQYFSMNGLLGGGHMWWGLYALWDLYTGAYIAALTVISQGLFKQNSPYVDYISVDNYVWVEGNQAGGAKAAFWELMAYVGQNQDAYLDDVANVIPTSAFLDPSSYSWSSPFTDYLVDAVFALMYSINDLVLEVGENFTNAQLLEKIKATDFHGVTGHVRFNEDGDRILEFAVKQLRFPAGTKKLFLGLQAQSVQVGTYVEKLVIEAPFRFVGENGPKWTPPPDKDLLCPIGQAYDRQNGVCRICDAGSYTSRSGQAQCEPCVPGSFAEGNGSTSCRPCPAGFAAELAGSTSCTACEAGRFNDAVQQSDCLQCERGTYAGEGSSVCHLCPPGSYAEGKGNGNCTLCDGPLTTRTSGATATEECLCPQGTYRDAEMRLVCHSCPEGMICGIGSDAANFPLVLSGNCTPTADACVIPETGPKFMTRKEEPLRSFLCLYPEACPGGPPGTCGANRNPDMVACGRCLLGAHMDKKKCVPCQKGVSIWGVVLLCIACLVCLAGTVFAVNRDLILQSNSTLSIMVVCGITLTSIQTMGVFRNLGLEWFEPLASIFSALMLLSFNLDILNLDCIFQPNAATMYLFRQLAGPFTLFILGFTVVFKKWLRRDIDMMVEYSNSAGTVFTALFISIASSCVLPLICYRHPGGSGESLLGDPTILCWQSRDHTWTVVIGAITFAVVLIPFLAIVLWGTLRHSEFVAQSVRGKGRWLSAFRFLFYRFMPHAYYYGSLLLARGLFICLVPVVIRYDVAFQVCVMSAILLTAQALQLQIQPWRSLLANVVDGAGSAALILFLVCGSASADMSANKSSIKLLGTIIFAALCASLIIGFAVCLVRYLRPTPYFQWFVCHHKRDAAAQARLLKIIMQLRNQTVFIDSDDLKDLDALFDIVKCAVGHLLVYLTRDVLTRPWCAGEIATTVSKGTRMTGIITPGWVQPAEEEIAPEALPTYLDLSSMTLAQYSISFESVAAAYRHLLGPAIRKLTPPEDTCGQARFHSIVGELLGRPIVERPAEPSPGMLIVSTDPNDDEATASAGILVSKAQAAMFSFMREGALLLVDGAIGDMDKVKEAIWAARAVTVVLSRRSLQCLEQLQVIATSLDRLRAGRKEGGKLPPFEVIPVTTPSFEFPPKDYFENTLPKIWVLEEELSTKDMALCLRSFFKRLAVNFSTHASDTVIESQAQQLVERVPQKWAFTGTTANDINRVRSARSHGVDRNLSMGEEMSQNFSQVATNSDGRTTGSLKGQVMSATDSGRATLRSLQALLGGDHGRSPARGSRQDAPVAAANRAAPAHGEHDGEVDQEHTTSLRTKQDRSAPNGLRENAFDDHPQLWSAIEKHMRRIEVDGASRPRGSSDTSSRARTETYDIMRNSDPDPALALKEDV